MESEETYDLPVIELKGSPSRMGEDFGEACRREIRELFEVRLRGAISFTAIYGAAEPSAEYVLRLAAKCLPVTQSFHPEGYDEFLGIARGANLSPQELFVANGLTDLRDILTCASTSFPCAAPDSEGCSAFIIARDRTACGRILAGQNWDLATDNMSYVRLVHRRPEKSPETVSLTLAGCLSLIGLNSEGVAVGTTNICTSDARIGVQYLSLIHRALQSRSAEEAVRSIEEAPRAAAHFYYVVDSLGNSIGLECSATRSRRTPVTAGTFVRCNHAMDPEIRRMESPTPTTSSSCRQQRLEQLLHSASTPLDVSHFKEFLGDHDGGDYAICRHSTPPDDISTNAAVIMSPETAEIHACRAQPHVGTWTSRTLGLP